MTAMMHSGGAVKHLFISVVVCEAEFDWCHSNTLYSAKLNAMGCK